MKKFLTALLLIAISSASFAGNDNNQNSHYEKRSPEKIVAKMDKKLDLSDEQAKQITAILNGSQKEMQAYHEKLQQLRKDTDAKISAVLTDEQRQKFDASRKQHQDKKPKKEKGEKAENNDDD